MIKEEYRYSELMSKIIGCAMEVHRQLGNGFQEVINLQAGSGNADRLSVKRFGIWDLKV